MSKSNGLETDLLKFIFNGTAVGSLTGITTLYLSLHTLDPGEAGDQTTNETSYGGYARQSIARNSGALLVTGNSVSPVGIITFPTVVSGNQQLTFAGIGTDFAGPGNLLYSGPLTPTLQATVGLTPKITPSSTITED